MNSLSHVIISLKWRVACFLASPATARWAAPIRTLRQIFALNVARRPIAEARKILVIRPDEIGDVVLATPFLRALRQFAPRARITVVVKSTCRELVELCPYIDAVHALDFTSGEGDGRRVRLYWAAWWLRWRRLPWLGFDLVLLPRRAVDWYGSEIVGHLLAGRGALVAHRDTMAKSSSNSPENASTAINFYSNVEIAHEVLHNLSFLRWCGAADSTNSCLELWLSDADRHFASTWLGEHFGQSAGVIVVHPSGGHSMLKQWPLKKFRALLNQLKRETRCSFLIIGGQDEGWIAREFADEVSERVTVAVGQFTLRQLSAVIERAELFVGGDSGPMHLAAAVGSPVIGIFGPTSEVRFRPWGPNSHVVSLRYACSPDVLGTFEDRCQTCRFSEPRCLTELSVDPIVTQVRALLAHEMHVVEIQRVPPRQEGR